MGDIMKVIRTLDEIDKIKDNTAVALGTFDGFHIGHKKVIQNLLDEANKRKLKTILFTFSNHPREIVNKNNKVFNIITYEEKILLAKEMGIDYLIIIEFNMEFMNIDPRQFIENILIEKLNVKLLSVGYNYRFGKNATGNVEMLKLYDNIFEVKIINAVYFSKYNVSSTMIRKLINDGKIEEANNLLGREYKLSGIVIKGKTLGRKLGFPTANLKLSSTMVKPKSGVYITKTVIDTIEYFSVTNIGKNPTFNQNEYTIETHILDFDKDIYGKKISIKFLKYLREEIKFKTIDELVDAIKMDIKYVEDYFKNL